MAETMGPLQSIDVPGVKLADDEARHLRQDVQRLLGRERWDFPGAQPVSFARHHLKELRSKDYYVCEKSDGIRYLLYLTIHPTTGDEAHFMIDRRNDYWYVTSGSTHIPTTKAENTFHQGTLLDGELVMDDIGNGRKEPTYLVFDCLALDGQNLMSRELPKRLGYFKEWIYNPYKALYKKYPEEKQYQSFFLGMKEMQVAYGIEMMFREVIKNLKHGNDGLIFTCLGSEYKPGTDPHILKWKAADENTVDFRWKLEWPTIQPDEEDIAEGWSEPYKHYHEIPQIQMFAYHGGNGPDSYRPFAEMYMTEEEWEELKALNEPLNDRIIEAYMDEQKRWRFYRFRDDKPNGNHISVIKSVLDSIEDGVTKEELLAAAKGIRDAWKERQQAQSQRRG
ncbi:hypothetical protein PG995_002131 [Apiospora arundinis]